MNVPRRQTLTQLTADALRESIAAGEWKGLLPSERELCQRLSVSRPTLRAALEILQREGFTTVVEPGKRRTILKTTQKECIATTRSIALVSRLPLYSMSRNRIFLIDSMNRALLEHGFRLEIVSHPAFGTNRPRRALQLLQERGNFRAYVLMLSSHAVQQWFCENGLPAIVVGSTFPGLSIPSIDSDYRSIGHHAAGLLLAKSHRQIAFVMPEIKHAGDLETEASFLKALQTFSGKEAACCRTIRYGTESKELVAKVDALLASSEPPTAYFVMNAMATTTLVTHLASRGIRIPDDISIITRDGDPLLEWIQPSMAHYFFPLRRMASRMSRLMLEMASSGTLPLNHIRLMPQFCKAQSLGMAPAIKNREPKS